MAFRTEEIRSWDQLVRTLVSLCRGWAFRGQFANWHLRTTIERCGPYRPSVSDAEWRLMQQFKRRADRYLEPTAVIEHRPPRQGRFRRE
jgi:hypothetical protein